MSVNNVIIPTHEDITHISFWDTPKYQVLNFWLTKFSGRQDVFTNPDAYEKPELTNYCYINREKIVKDLYEYLESVKQ